LFNFTPLIYIKKFVLKHNIQKIIEQELVISKTVSRPESSLYEFSPEGTLCFGGREYFNAFTTDFLGFSESRRILGSYYCGKSKNVEVLEQNITAFLQTQDTFLTGSYEGLCVEIFEDLLNKNDVIIYDSAVSPWIRKGIKICDADKKRYFHNDLDALENLLKLSVVNRLKVIVTDGVFYDSGQCADLNKIRLLAEKYDAVVVIDDSFGFLTCGKKGHGADELCGVKNFQDLKIVNMQNALCCSVGAFVSGNKTLIEILRLRSKSLKNSVSVDEDSVLTALKILQDGVERRQSLMKNALKLYEIFSELGFKPQKPVAGIVSFVSQMQPSEINAVLRDAGVLCQITKVGKNSLVTVRVSAGDGLF
jgi:glycine C-acetyltransferase